MYTFTSTHLLFKYLKNVLHIKKLSSVISGDVLFVSSYLILILSYWKLFVINETYLRFCMVALMNIGRPGLADSLTFFLFFSRISNGLHRFPATGWKLAIKIQSRYCFDKLIFVIVFSMTCNQRIYRVRLSKPGQFVRLSLMFAMNDAYYFFHCFS